MFPSLATKMRPCHIPLLAELSNHLSRLHFNKPLVPSLLSTCQRSGLCTCADVNQTQAEDRRSLGRLLTKDSLHIDSDRVNKTNVVHGVQKLVAGDETVSVNQFVMAVVAGCEIGWVG